MVKRTIACLLALLLLLTVAFGDMQWKQDTPAQQILKQYIEAANAYLAEHGEIQINSLFEIYDGFAVFGVTGEADAETPEGIEITVLLKPDILDRLELRVNDPDRFPAIAAALIQAMYGDQPAAEKTLEIPGIRAEQAKAEPAKSYEEPVEAMNGTLPRIYYAYYPNQYRDGVNWIQMTIVFPMAGYWDGENVVFGQQLEEKNLDPDGEADAGYEGYYSTDDYSHFEVFTTETPEPDSAAAEYDFR